MFIEVFCWLEIFSSGLQLRIIFHIVNGDGCFGDIRCDEPPSKVNKNEESWTNAT